MIAIQERTLSRPTTPTKPLRHVPHPSFEEADAEQVYSAREVLEAARDDAAGYMPDEVTRDFARRMHYAAYRASRATRKATGDRWRGWYHALRDQIILGNRKLVFRAVQMRMRESRYADDLIGECDIVMIQAVSAYNPWMGVRFSTYAFTCLQRALFRLNKKQTGDRLAQCLSLTADPSLAALAPYEQEVDADPVLPFLDLLQEEHPLLTAREKTVLKLRYLVEANQKSRTLEQVGHDLGISKERVRQLQLSALTKLREALAEEVPSVKS